MSLDATPYLKSYRETHGPSSVAAADLWIPKLVTYLGDQPLSAEALYNWRQSLVTVGYKPSSINRAIATVRGFLKYLRIKGLHNIDSELLGDALAPARVSTMLPTVLTRDEIKNLCITAGCASRMALEYNRPVATFLVLGLLTGMRPGEILRCRPEHHKPERGLLIYSTKLGKERCVPLADNPELAMLLSGAPAAPTYCAGFSTFHWDALTKAALGRTINRKLLRSTHSSYLASSGKISEFAYCSRMGHTLEVANNYYRSMISGVTGDTVADWLGAKAEIVALVRRICS